jgi:monothiol glutaredoxin
MIRGSRILLLLATLELQLAVDAFSPQLASASVLGAMTPPSKNQKSLATTWMSSSDDGSKEVDPVQAVIDAMYGGKPLSGESPEATQARIEELIQGNQVLLFMKGAKSFPQCGFSDTATKILETLKVDFHTVDVLSDEAIRQGIKEFSQWPTIPQLYIRGEFIGGSDIILEMYEKGELADLLEEKDS